MEINKFCKANVIISILITIFTLSAYAVPMNISYQGFLLDNNGSPINGDLTISFNLYATDIDNQSLWNETHREVKITDGIFNVILGTERAFTNDLFDNDLYLGISIDGSTEMSPRRQLTSTAFSMRAREADYVKGSNISDHSIDITKLAFADQDGNIEISGNIKAGSFIGDASQLSGVVKEEYDPVWKAESLNYWTKGELKRVNSREFSGAFSIGVFDSFFNSNSSNLQDVLDDLDVAITNKMDVSNNDAGIWSKGGNNFYYLDGNIGIGTSEPSATLDVNGSFIRRVARASSIGPHEKITKGQITSRVLRFNKTKDDTAIKVSYTDILAPYCVSCTCGCKWEIRVDGQSCPGEKLAYDVLIYNTKADIRAFRSRTVNGYCEGVPKGDHEIQIWVDVAAVGSPESCQCLTGLGDARWTIDAEEVY
jgi:hypothetical protein